MASLSPSPSGSPPPLPSDSLTPPKSSSAMPPPSSDLSPPPPKESVSPPPPPPSNETSFSPAQPPPPQLEVPPGSSPLPPGSSPLPPPPNSQTSPTPPPPPPSNSQTSPTPPPLLPPQQSSNNHGVLSSPPPPPKSSLGSSAHLTPSGGSSVFFSCARKRKKSQAQMHLGPDQSCGSTGTGAEQYYGSSSQGEHHQNWKNGVGAQPNHHIVNVASPPPSGSRGAHGNNWPTPPPLTMLILLATIAGFSQANLLGQGGFGYVHKGVLPNGKEMAVKSLESSSGQGNQEFQAEVEIISRVHHHHLVSLVGYCLAAGRNMLIYEFLPNNNLEFHLHGNLSFYIN
ncbi:Tyrosine-protein kinase [Trema orientale]|uniref:non-specific serine/threonine protein kinase n=1 Tax=Trema orientale TaxID=63057 RepID=A0A2P5EH87_TREOI|nr:Tyrosine-protein kinase [Trema orientale]